MAANLPIVDPKKVLCPVLMMRGEFDGNSTNEDLLEFYNQLPNGDRQFVILPNTAHSVGFQPQPASDVLRPQQFPRRSGADRRIGPVTNPSHKSFPS